MDNHSLQHSVIDGNFKIDMLLGTGGSSKVYSCYDPAGNLYAAKVIRTDRKFSEGLGKTLLETEIKAMQLLQDHPNVLDGFYVNTSGILDSAGKKEEIMYCIIELAKKGAIKTFVKKSGCFEEAIVRFYAVQICNALSHIHSKGLAHMDIKVDNILLDENYNAKIADLGTCAETEFGYTSRRCGTKQYMAPEILKGDSDSKFNAFKSDAYSLGVTLYVMLTDNFPSSGESTILTEESGNFSADVNESKDSKCLLSHLSEDCKDFMSSLLNEDPMKRPSIADALDHPWISNCSEPIPEFEVYMEMKAREDYIVGSCPERS